MKQKVFNWAVKKRHVRHGGVLRTAISMLFRMWGKLQHTVWLDGQEKAGHTGNTG